MIFLDIPAMYNYSNVNTLYQQALDTDSHVGILPPSPFLGIIPISLM